MLNMHFICIAYYVEMLKSVLTYLQTLPSKWANAGVDIRLDNLSPASKFQRSAAPTINQLQSASGQPQAMPMAQPMPVGQPVPMAQPVGVVPAIPVAQPGAPMQTGAGELMALLCVIFSMCEVECYD